ARVAVVNTNKRRGLVDSEYNARRRECEEGAAFFAARIPGVKALRDVTMEQFAAYESELPEPIRRRSRHVVSECQRVLDSVEALKAGDLERFGQLMNQSDRKSTRLNSSHVKISYAVFCLKKKKEECRVYTTHSA